MRADLSLIDRSSSISSSVLERVKAADQEAWRRLCQMCAPLVYRWARQAGLQTHDATDIVQEVFRSVATAIGGFRRERPHDSFRGWLWTITHNKVRDHFRRQDRRPEAFGGTDAQRRLQRIPDVPDDDSSAAARHETSLLLHRALDLVRCEFEPQTWKAFWATAVECRPPQDVADELGMTVAAVYMAKSRVFRRVREEVQGLLPYG